MTGIVRNRLTYVWIALSVITVISWRFAAMHAAGEVELNAIGATAIALIACVKCALVLWQFMEVHGAPAWLRRTCFAWLVMFFAAVLGLYFYPP
jgi:Prokaryotic Cytochrome C oxidase subunit IV